MWPHSTITNTVAAAACVLMASFACATACGQDANQLNRRWTSEHGNHTRVGTLVDVSPSHAQILCDGAHVNAQRRLLCACDRLFLARLENIDLRNSAAVDAALVGFDIECAIHKGFQLRTAAGVTIHSSSIRVISPVEIEYIGPDGWPTVIRCSDLDLGSQRLLSYNIGDEPTYENARRELKRRRILAFRACRLLSSQIQDSPVYVPESYDTRYRDVVLRESWGHAWKQGKFANGEYTPGAFLPNPNDAFIDFWTTHAGSPEFEVALRADEEDKKARRKKRAEDQKRKQLASRARRRKLNSLVRSYSSYGGASYGSPRTYSVRKTWVNGYYRRDGTYVRGHWRHYD